MKLFVQAQEAFGFDSVITSYSIHYTKLYEFDAELKGTVAHGLFVGGMIGYQSYYKKYPRDTYYFDKGALTSTIFKYYYTVPIRVVADYFLNPDGFVQPFVGLSTGVNYNERRLEVGFYSFEDKSWNFVVAPEASYNFV